MDSQRFVGPNTFFFSLFAAIFVSFSMFCLDCFCCHFTQAFPHHRRTPLTFKVGLTKTHLLEDSQQPYTVQWAMEWFRFTTDARASAATDTAAAT